MQLTDLPALNAGLNALAGVLLLCGYASIRAKRIPLHRSFMLAAFAVSTLFLVSYLIYHFQVQFTAYRGEGFLRPLYFSLLIPHVILAVALVPLVLTTLHRAWREILSVTAESPASPFPSGFTCPSRECWFI